jgi:hypothetical protein
MSLPVHDDPETGLELPAMAAEESPGKGGAANARRRQRFVLGSALLGLGLAAAVVGGVCGHGSGQCRRQRQQNIVASTTPLQPTPMPSPFPSQVPSDLPSSQPSDVPSMMPSGVPSAIPSGVPTTLPTPSPTSRPSTKPTTESLFTASSLEEEEATAPGCPLVGCYLRNLDSGVEQGLDPTTPTSYSITTTSRNGPTTTTTSSRYSIRCDYTSADVIVTDFFVPTTTADAGPSSPSAANTTTFALYHREHVAPFWMQSNSANWIEPVPYLSTCDDTAANASSSVTKKMIRVAAAETDNAMKYCLDLSFKLLAQCQEKTEKPQVATTTSSIAAPPSAVASSEEEVVEEADSVPIGTSASVAKDDPTASCAMACYFHDIDTGVDLVMEETGTIAYAVAADGSSRYSIRCDPDQDDMTRIAYAKFFFNGQDRREFNAPFWMQSNSSGGGTTSDWIEPAPYLTTCDNHEDDGSASSKKTVRIALATNNDDGEEYYCRDVTFDLVAQCH